MLTLIYSWIDLLWIPVIALSVHKQHRWWALGFAIGSITLTHLLTDFMIHIGYEHGIMGIMSSNVQIRAHITSSIFYALFILLAHYSKNTRGIVFMAASLTFFFAIFVTLSLVMLL